MIELFFFLLLVAGLTVLTLPELKDSWRIFIFRMEAWRSSFRNEQEWLQNRKERYEEQVLEHIRRLLQVTLSLGTKKSVRYFLLLSGMLGISVFLLVLQRMSALLAAGSGLMAAMLPYLALRCILQSRQVTGSHEGEILVTELLNNYKIHYCNMIQAIEVTAMTIEGAPYSRKLLLNLSRGLNKASGAAQLEALMEEFRFAIGTSWAGILATNLFLACHSGMRVTESLSDLACSMADARRVEEFSRREHNESGVILRWLIPGGNVLLTAGGIHFFGLTAAEWFHCQFQSGTGVTWFILSLLSYLTAAGVHILLSRRKFDL